MKPKPQRALTLSCAFLAFFSLRGGLAPQTDRVQVDCDAGVTISGVLGSLKPGDHVLVRGRCEENVLIPVYVMGVTLDGQGKATLHGPDVTRAPLTILGRGITIRGFTITGGRNGINILRGGTALIEGNTIQNTGAGKGPGSGDGVNLAQHSYAQLINNTIQNNPGHGIAVHESSSARIGFTDVDNVEPRPNLIRANGAHGVFVFDASTAMIVGNTIRENTGDGVHVAQVGHALVSGNEISGNTGSGVRIRQNSGATLGAHPGNGRMGGPNKTEPKSKNAEFGVRCSAGAYADGQLGTLSGGKGATQFDKTCVNRLVR